MQLLMTLLLMTTTLHAAEALNKDAVENLLADRKVEGRNVVWTKE